MDALEVSRTEARSSAEALGMERKAAAALRDAMASSDESSRLQHSSLRSDFGEVSLPRTRVACSRLTGRDARSAPPSSRARTTRSPTAS